MNEDIIMTMVSPYIKHSSLSYDDFDNLFGSLLSQQEQYEVATVLLNKGIELVDNYPQPEPKEPVDAPNYYDLVKPYINKGYLTYDDFDTVFSDYSRKEQYEIVEELFSFGVELIDLDSEETSTKEDDVFDPINISVEDKVTEDFQILYDESIFQDSRNSSPEVILYSNIKQSNEILCSLIQNGNQQAQQDICVKNQRLVLKYATAYLGFYGNDLELEDLEQMGYIGLLKAAKRFDLSMGMSFSTYAVFWIKQSIKREIADHGYTIRLPVHMIEKIIKATKLDTQYDMQGLTQEERMQSISKDMEMSIEDVRYLFVLRQKYLQCTSINIPIGEKLDTELEEVIPDEDSPTVEEVVYDNVFLEKLKYVLSTLRPREREVIELRYGLIDGKIRTLSELGDKYGLTRERVRQIEQKALRKLRHYSRSKFIKWYYKDNGEEHE